MSEKFKVYLLLGSDVCNLYENCSENSDIDEVFESVKIYEFETENELNAFLFGISEAIAYFDYCLLSEKDYFSLKEKYES